VDGLSVREVSKAFGPTHVLHGVSLEIAPGELVALLGPSGCGKTTLMRIVAGIEVADAGAVRIGARDVTRLHPGRRDVAMVFQNYALYPHLTVRQNIAVPLAMRRLSTLQRLPLLGALLPGTRAARRAIAEDVGRVAAPRVALARAVVRAPSVFLLDEPLSNLDAALRVSTRREIVDIHRRVGAATLYVTHDQSEALTMADRVAVMLGGRLLQVAPPAEIYENPADIAVARFIGSPAINLLPVEADAAGMLRFEGQALGLHSAARGALTLGIRPEALRPAAHGLPAVAEHVEYLGEAALLHARLGDAPVVMRVEPSLRAAPGEALHLAFDPARALLFGADGQRAALREAQHA
jgi:multiple sugar transport system ATP-binding protein